MKNLIDQYLSMSDWRVKENSNSAYSISALSNYVAESEVAKYCLKKVYSKRIAKAHKSGDIHIHDLGHGLMSYCAGWGLEKLLMMGFTGGFGKVQSRPAKHLRSILGQIVNFIGTLQNEWAGAQAFNGFDTFLAPFIRYDKISYKEIKQSLQEFIFNMNIVSRWGSQCPFSNITLDLVVPKDVKGNAVVIGGKLQKETYSDFQKEMNIFNKALLEIYLEGDAVGRPFTFPIPTYSLTEDFNWNSKVAELLFKVTAKYGLPYFQNFINSNISPSDVRSLCCRLQLSLKELRQNVTGGLFGSGSSTGSLGVVTINLPRAAYLAKGNKKKFFALIKKNMDLASKSLEVKRDLVNKLMEGGLYPYTSIYLGTFQNHFSTIGLVGMNEACLNLLNNDITSKEGRRLAKNTLMFMRQQLLKYQKKTKHLYNLEATPAEGTSFRLARLDKKEFKDIKTAGKDEIYYTNSTQIPVNSDMGVLDMLEHQEDLQTLYSGGCIEKGNRVLTDKGLLLIENIVNDFKEIQPIRVLSYNQKEDISEWDTIVDAMKINVKEKNKIRIKGERCLDIVTSDWHPFFVLERIKGDFFCPVCTKSMKNVKAFAVHLKCNKECERKYDNMNKYQVVKKRADELKIGDYILQNSHNLYSKKDSRLNNDLMWLIGFFIGDGHVSHYIDNRGGNNLRKYVVRFHSEHIETLEKVTKILDKYFDCKVKIIRNDKRSKSLREVVTSKINVLDFFFKYGFKSGKKVYDVSISQMIKKNITRTNVYALLSGLIDSDGHIDKKCGLFEYYSVSSQLIDDILEICTKAGIIISKKLKPTKRKNEVDGWRLTIPSYEATKIKNQLSNTFNSERIKTVLSNRKKRQFPVVRVKRISKVNVEDNQFYDLTTKKNHNYLAGKDCLVFVHNTVAHIYLGESSPSIQSLKSFVKKIAHNTRLPYFTVTPVYSICPTHKYIVGNHPKCPTCGKPTEVYSRIVGYFRPVAGWNDGKKEEFKERTLYNVIEDPHE